MPIKNNKKEMLLHAAHQLFHSQGYAKTTLADIAEISGVPLGNVYYYFKTKLDLVLAIINQNILEYNKLYAQWEKQEPKLRLTNFVEIYEKDAESIARYGCPNGSLSLELRKDSIMVEKSEVLLENQLEWLTTHFKEIGRTDSRKLSLHMMTSLQGCSLLAATLNDKTILIDEIERLKGLVNKI